MPTHKLPPNIHVLTKPTGAICNLDCAYCFALDKELLYPGSRFRMSDETLELYIRQLIETHRDNRVTVAWQGGEPTMMKLDFFRRAIALQEKYKKPGMLFDNTMQTNGTLLTDEWCEFFIANKFLIGISIDGPAHLHDTYRVDKKGRSTFDDVLRGVRLLQKHGVEYNVLCTINRANGNHPLEVYRYLRDQIGTTWMQFIPIIERVNPDGTTLYQQGSNVSDESVLPEQFGNFLSVIFDEWIEHDVGKVFVQGFEAATRNWLGMNGSGICIFDETCGYAVALEHTGDVYSCDHFVEPNYLLGNLKDHAMADLVGSDKQYKFGKDKSDALPQQCKKCDVRFACHGECPKNRFATTSDGEAGLNYLCAGYHAFFHHIDAPMKLMTGLMRQGHPADHVMPVLKKQKLEFAKARPNDPCPCGSQKKFKKCHGVDGKVKPKTPATAVAGLAGDEQKNSTSKVVKIHPV